MATAASIASGGNHTIAALANGSVVAWGAGGTNLGWGLTNVPAGLTNVVTVAAGMLHSMALRRDGSVVAWGHNADGQTNVPASLSNAQAISAGISSSLALGADGNVVSWGSFPAAPTGLSNVVRIASGGRHALAVRSGRLIPLILAEPQDAAVLAGESVSFSVRAASLGAPRYQWRFNGSNIAGATNQALSLSGVSEANFGLYTVVVSNGAGSVVSRAATLGHPNPPVITFPTNTTYVFNKAGEVFSLSPRVQMQASFSRYPLHYFWKHNGQSMGEGLSIFGLRKFQVGDEGTYTVTVSNAVGMAVSAQWIVGLVLGNGAGVGAGLNSAGQLNWPSSGSNVIALACGLAHNLGLREDGTVFAWGANDLGQTNVPAGLSNVTAVAAGATHSLALKADGTVVGWGDNGSNQITVPVGLTDVVGISAGGQQSLALKRNGTVVQWGRTFPSVPAGLANVAAIASGTNFHLALLTNRSVVAWGTNSHGQLNLPSGLTNVVAIAANGAHALALREDGTVAAWGSNGSGESTVPASSWLTNAMGVAAGESHSVALRNDGTIVAWGDNAYYQTNMSAPSRIIRVAAGKGYSLAVMFSGTVQYPVDVTKDLLLICNTNSPDSVFVKNYYLAHRPMVAGANVLDIACAAQETVTRSDFTNNIRTPIVNWLNANPTKRPQYWVLFLGIPSRTSSNTNAGPHLLAESNSVSFELSLTLGGPFVTHINMGSTNGMGNTNDCKLYIDKLAFVGANYSPGTVLISASRGGYGNTNYYFDDSGFGSVGGARPAGAGYAARQGVLSVSPLASVVYTNVEDFCTNLTPHIRTGVNVAGYLCHGVHSALGSIYAIDTNYVAWSGHSGWWIIETIESCNGWWYPEHGNFIRWFSPNAFGGTSCANTPVGAVSQTDEPGGAGVNDSDKYFGLWEMGKNFAICAWGSRNTAHFQAVGDPLVTK